jgi:hypothetical protein
MSILQKGILTVIGATLTASVLILFLGKSATAESGGESLVEEASAVGAQPLNSRESANIATSLPPKGASIENKLSAEHLQQKQRQNNLLPSASPMSPPPIGPFQVAQPNSFGLFGTPQNTSKKGSISVAPVMKQHAPSGVAILKQNMKAPKKPTLKIMNPQAPQSPKVIDRPQHKLGLSPKMMSAPVNTLIKPQAPVQKTPDMPTAPTIQRYMYVPVPVPVYKQAPMLPNPSTLQNKQQPRLQPNK